MYSTFGDSQSDIHLMDPWLDSTDYAKVLEWLKFSFLTHCASSFSLCELYLEVPRLMPTTSPTQMTALVSPFLISLLADSRPPPSYSTSPSGTRASTTRSRCARCCRSSSTGSSRTRTCGSSATPSSSSGCATRSRTTRWATSTRSSARCPPCPPTTRSATASPRTWCVPLSLPLSSAPRASQLTLLSSRAGRPPQQVRLLRVPVADVLLLPGRLAHARQPRPGAARGRHAPHAPLGLPHGLLRPDQERVHVLERRLQVRGPDAADRQLLDQPRRDGRRRERVGHGDPGRGDGAEQAELGRGGRRRVVGRGGRGCARRCAGGLSGSARCSIALSTRRPMDALFASLSSPILRNSRPSLPITLARL